MYNYDALSENRIVVVAQPSNLMSIVVQWYQNRKKETDTLLQHYLNPFSFSVILYSSPFLAKHHVHTVIEGFAKQLAYTLTQVATKYTILDNTSWSNKCSNMGGSTLYCLSIISSSCQLDPRSSGRLDTTFRQYARDFA